jgi:hypothetical protein
MRTETGIYGPATKHVIKERKNEIFEIAGKIDLNQNAVVNNAFS